MFFVTLTTLYCLPCDEKDISCPRLLSGTATEIKEITYRRYLRLLGRSTKLTEVLLK